MVTATHIYYGKDAGDMGGRPGGAGRLARARRGGRRGRQGDPPGLARCPGPRYWRMDWTRNDGLVDSWAMLAQNPDGTYLKPNWFGWRDRRCRPTASGGRPCWATSSTLLGGPGRAGLHRAPGPAGRMEHPPGSQVQGACADLPHRPDPGHPAGRLHGAGRGAQLARGRAVPVHPRHRGGQVESTRA